GRRGFEFPFLLPSLMAKGAARARAAGAASPRSRGPPRLRRGPARAGARCRASASTLPLRGHGAREARLEVEDADPVVLDGDPRHRHVPDLRQPALALLRPEIAPCR